MRRIFSLIVSTLFVVFLQAEVVLAKNLQEKIEKQLAKEHVPGEFIVKFKKNKATMMERYFLMNGLTIKKNIKSIDATVVKLVDHSEIDLRGWLKRLNSLAEVEYAEPNFIYHAIQTPNDEKFSELYGMLNNTTAGADISATKAWDLTTGSKNIKVAVIDTGIDYNHEDLKDNIWSNPGETGLDAQGRDKATNGIDDDGNGYVDDVHGWNFVAKTNDPMDDHGHGTHCAGTIGGVGNNGKGVTGVNWQVSLVPVKFLSGSGSGTTEDAISSIDYATRVGVDVMSNSWGGGGFSQALFDAIANAEKKGILFVAAAGNDNSNNDEGGHYPSNYEVANVISVAATDIRDDIASFSNFGKNSVHLGAPGVQILSSIPNNSYDKFSGTSMACPHVAGAAALVKSLYPNMSYQQIKSRLMGSADLTVQMTQKTVSGGRLNVFAALENDSIAPAKVQNVATKGLSPSEIEISWDPTGDDGLVGTAKSYEVRFSPTPLDSLQAWEKARVLAQVFIKDAEAARVSTTIGNLENNIKGFVAVRAFDNVGNSSEWSDQVRAATVEVEAYLTQDFSNTDGWELDTWGLEKDDTDHGMVLSDSPGKPYDDYANKSAVLKNVDLPGGFAMITFETRYDLETNYDVGLVEASFDEGTTWAELAKFTGQQETWKTVSMSVRKEGQSTMWLRFRLKADNSISKDGWFIDNLKLWKAKSF